MRWEDGGWDKIWQNSFPGRDIGGREGRDGASRRKGAKGSKERGSSEKAREGKEGTRLIGEWEGREGRDRGLT
jgi:hypothetical protein